MLRENEAHDFYQEFQSMIRMEFTVGPITLFDKSFIQSLSVDESVWFDNFFLAVVCPTFFIETLADLSKSPREGRTPESEIRIIASKFPEMHGSPCINYMELSVASLLGYETPMDGRVPRPGGRPVSGGGKSGTVFDQSHEEAAFQRWQDEAFSEVEKDFAKIWRATLQAIDLEEIARTFRSLGINPQSCRSLAEARQIAIAIVNGRGKTFGQIVLAVRLLHIPSKYHNQIRERWRNMGEPTLAALAPYAAHVVAVETFFQAALAAKLIASERNSNRTDISYLFYLPFCQLFVSNDKLHRSTASLFLRPDQEFVWGQDLKDDLRKINAHYGNLPETEKAKGIMRFAGYPPVEEAALTSKIWQRREFDSHNHNENLANNLDPESHKRILEEIKSFTKGKPISPREIGIEGGDAMAIERRIGKKKGSWWQLPADFPISDDC